MFNVILIMLITFSLWGTSVNPVEAQNNTKAKAALTPSSDFSFVILQYHHVSSETPRVTSVSPEELEAHMAYLAENHEVVSLESALDSIKNRTALANKSVVITFDDGYKNILENGHPILRKYGFEYTIFINPDQIGVISTQLTWKDVEQMSNEGVTFANHTLGHIHLLDRKDQENKSKWLARIKNNIIEAENKLTEQLGYSKKWLAYPFGEFDVSLRNMLADMSYTAFGQHSGAVGQYSDLLSLPRFPAAGRYSNLDTLRTKMNSLAMPVTEVRPLKYLIGLEQTLGSLHVGILLDDINLGTVACYFKGSSLPILKTNKGFSFDIEGVFYAGRARVNCTAPSIKQSDRFYWYSIPFFTPKEDGTFLD
jgi:peptidoglycan/xylan/chitin deacetylase (PgdA/CDA1 family)